MDLLRIIRSIEELLYELTSWLIFYPRTMWRAVRHPFEAMDYVAAEESEAEEEQFTDGLSPPLLLFVTILLGHIIEIGSVGVVRPHGGAIGTIFASEEFLLLFRALLFSLFPLLGAVATVKALAVPLTRQSLRTPFFSLCMLAAPFALAQSIGSVLTRATIQGSTLAGVTLMAIASLYYLACQGLWMRRTAGVSKGRAAAMSLFAFAQALVYVLLVATLVVRGSTF